MPDEPNVNASAQEIAELKAKLAAMEKRYEPFKDFKDEDVTGFVQDYQRLAQLGDYTRLMLSKESSAADRAKALEVVLGESGYSQEEIQAQVADLMRLESGAAPQEPKVEKPLKGGVDRTNPNDEVIRRLEAQVKALQEQTHKEKAVSLSERLQKLVSEQLEQPEIKVLLEKSKDSAKAREYLNQSIDKSARDILRQQRDSTGTFDENWMVDAAKRAAKNQLEVFRSVIGDPNLLGRVPETDSGVETLLKQKPVEEPKVPFGAKRSEEQKLQFDSFSKDTLMRAAAEAAQGSNTKV